MMLRGKSATVSRMRRWAAFTSILAVGALCVGRSQAHHAFASVFDPEQPVSLIGTIIGVEWTNPHAWCFIDVENGAGEPEKWELELGSPNNLKRLGWTRETLIPGMVVHIRGYRARDGSSRAAISDLKVPSGTLLSADQTALE